MTNHSNGPPVVERRRQPRHRGPSIERLNARIATLERRLDHLYERINDERRSESQKSWDRSEAAALEAALRALRFHRAAADEHTDPVAALAALVEAAEDAIDAGYLGETLDLEAALGRAQIALEAAGHSYCPAEHREELTKTAQNR